jgi:outer membrane protein insertion porin family
MRKLPGLTRLTNPFRTSVGQACSLRGVSNPPAERQGRFSAATRLAAAVLLAASLCAGQTRAHHAKPAAPPDQQDQSSWPLSSLTVSGNHAYTREQILAAAGLRVGEVVSKKAFEAARERLLATGNFRTVGYSYEPNEQGNGYSGRLEVAEEDQLYPIGFDSLPATNEELLAVLKAKDPLYGDRVPATEPVVQRYVGYLAAYLAGKGYHEKITGALAAESTPELVLLFRPSIRPSIAQVKFTGNKAIRQEELQVAIANVAVGTVYIAPRFQAFLDNSVRPVYESHGYVRVTFPKVTVEKATDVNGVVVTVQVDEGQIYKLAAVKAPETAELVKIAGLKTGDVFDGSQVSKAQQKIVATWHRRGYMHASTSVDRQINEKDKTVTLLLHVDAGPLYTFRTLTIQGLDVVSEPAIRKMWGMPVGHPYNVDYPDRFLKVVKEEGVLDNLGDTKADAKVDEDAHVVDVTLLFNGTLSEKGKKRREGDREKPPDTDNPARDNPPFPE